MDSATCDFFVSQAQAEVDKRCNAQVKRHRIERIPTRAPANE
jgi:hypothetical protein